MTVVALVFACYLGFYAVPLGGPGEGDFTPEQVAAHEVGLWQSARAGEEVGTFLHAVQLQREQYRLSWFRAVQAGFFLARASLTFATMKERYERVLPDLEAIAGVEKQWTGKDIDPQAIARAELTWWVTRRLPHLNTVDQLGPLVGRDYELRYRLRPGAASDAATRRAEAMLMFDAEKVDPNIPAITKALTDSYQALRRTLVRTDATPRD